MASYAFYVPNGQEAFQNVTGWDPEAALIVAEMGWSSDRTYI
jgi:nicotinamide mononucleotide adenylyltransferase